MLKLYYSTNTIFTNQKIVPNLTKEGNYDKFNLLMNFQELVNGTFSVQWDHLGQGIIRVDDQTQTYFYKQHITFFKVNYVDEKKQGGSKNSGIYKVVGLRYTNKRTVEYVVEIDVWLTFTREIRIRNPYVFVERQLIDRRDTQAVFDYAIRNDPLLKVEDVKILYKNYNLSSPQERKSLYIAKNIIPYSNSFINHQIKKPFNSKTNLNFFGFETIFNANTNRWLKYDTRNTYTSKSYLTLLDTNEYTIPSDGDENILHYGEGDVILKDVKTYIKGTFQQFIDGGPRGEPMLSSGYVRAFRLYGLSGNYIELKPEQLSKDVMFNLIQLDFIYSPENTRFISNYGIYALDYNGKPEFLSDNVFSLRTCPLFPTIVDTEDKYYKLNQNSFQAQQTNIFLGFISSLFQAGVNLASGDVGKSIGNIGQGLFGAISQGITLNAMRQDLKNRPYEVKDSSDELYSLTYLGYEKINKIYNKYAFTLYEYRQPQSVVNSYDKFWKTNGYFINHYKIINSLEDLHIRKKFDYIKTNNFENNLDLGYYPIPYRDVLVKMFNDGIYIWNDFEGGILKTLKEYGDLSIDNEEK